MTIVESVNVVCDEEIPIPIEIDDFELPKNIENILTNPTTIPNKTEASANGTPPEEPSHDSITKTFETTLIPSA